MQTHPCAGRGEEGLGLLYRQRCFPAGWPQHILVPRAVCPQDRTLHADVGHPPSLLAVGAVALTASAPAPVGAG